MSFNASGEGGGGVQQFELPTSCNLYSWFLHHQLLQNITQCCIFPLFFLDPATLGIPHPALSSPASCRLPIPTVLSSLLPFPGFLPLSCPTCLVARVLTSTATLLPSRTHYYTLVDKEKKVFYGGTKQRRQVQK